MECLLMKEVSVDLLEDLEDLQKFDYFEQGLIRDLDALEQLIGLWLDDQLVGLFRLSSNNDASCLSEIKAYCLERYGSMEDCEELFEYLDQTFPAYQSG